MSRRKKVPDPDAITLVEAAALLRLPECAVTRLRREGFLIHNQANKRVYSRTDVETFLANPWINGTQAAEILGVSHERISQLAAADFIPVHHGTSGKRFYRRLQLEVVANARRHRRELTAAGHPQPRLR